MLGLTGHSDMRDVKAEYHKGNKEAVLAYDMYAYRIKRYIGSFAAVLNGLRCHYLHSSGVRTIPSREA